MRRTLNIGLRLCATGLCVFAIWCSIKLAWADYLRRQDTKQSIQAAIQLEPDAADYFLRLAQLDEPNAMQYLQAALRLNPYDAMANIELGLHFEADGDYTKAERLLLDAFAIDRTFLPRWTLANFYFRRDNVPAFWKWARMAAAMPSESTGPLFELCWRIAPDPQSIEKSILNDDPELLREYFDFLLVKRQFEPAAEIGRRLVQHGSRITDGARLIGAVNRLVVENHGDAAQALWRSLVAQGWAAADPEVLNNPKFARDPLPVAFDWALSSYPGLHSLTGPDGLESDFDGRQPERCMVAGQVVVLAPGNYSVQYSYHTQGIDPGTGLRWDIYNPYTNETLATSEELSSEKPQQSSFEFTVPSESPALQVRLMYQRSVGTPRISGSIMVSSVHIISRGE